MAVTDQDLAHVWRAIEIAPRGRFAVEPNPMVGCVLVKHGMVVAEGWHGAYGGAHAEVDALAKAGDRARGATAYVSLEPCSRVMKTGACTVALEQAGVKRVVFAASDPNMGAFGLEDLRAAGIEVEGPVLEDEGRKLLDRFLLARDLARPWVILKWAMSLDGRISPARGRGGPISGPEAHAYVHWLRAYCDGVAVGVETARVDDPRLTSRLEGGLPPGREQPLRVILDSRLRLPPASRMLDETPRVGVFVICSRPDAGRRQALEARGADIVVVAEREGRVDLAAALGELHAMGVRRLLVEGGAEIHRAFLDAGLADQVLVFTSPHAIGGDAPLAVTGADTVDVARALGLEQATRQMLGEDVMQQGYLPRGGRGSAGGAIGR